MQPGAALRADGAGAGAQVQAARRARARRDGARRLLAGGAVAGRTASGDDRRPPARAGRNAGAVAAHARRQLRRAQGRRVVAAHARARRPRADAAVGRAVAGDCSRRRPSRGGRSSRPARSSRLARKAASPMPASAMHAGAQHFALLRRPAQLGARGLQRLQQRVLGLRDGEAVAHQLRLLGLVGLVAGLAAWQPCRWPWRRFLLRLGRCRAFAAGLVATVFFFGVAAWRRPSCSRGMCESSRCERNV